MAEFWTEELGDRIETRHDAPYFVSDWKTPSGRISVGHLRGVVLHDAVARSLRLRGHETRYVYGFDDFDPMTKVPSYLDAAAYQSYLGQPFTAIPLPDDQGRPSRVPVTATQNYARFFADEFELVYRQLGVESETLRTTDLYHEGFFDPAIQLVLDHVDEVRGAYQVVLEEHRSADRREKAVVAEYPLNVRCEACGKLVTTEVTGWDGSAVSYRCPSDRRVAPYVDGCGHEGSVAPFGGTAKLPWKVEWAAKWWRFEVDVEGAGKDHYTKGGSRDVSLEIFRRIFLGTQPPEAQHKPQILEDLFYEWFYIGGKKMSTSKGVGVSARDVIHQVPPELLRFLMVRTKPKSGVDFEVTNDTVARLFDEYDRVLATAATDPAAHEAALMRVASVEAHELPAYTMRFSKVAQLTQLLHLDLNEVAEAEKGSPLSEVEQHELQRRIEYAKQWIAREPDRLVIQEDLPAVELTEPQRQFLAALAERMQATASATGEQIQAFIHELKTETGIAPKEAFQAIYRIFLNRDQGPQAGLFLAALDHDFVVERLREASTLE